jgi:hypothetical protein
MVFSKVNDWALQSIISRRLPMEVKLHSFLIFSAYPGRFIPGESPSHPLGGPQSRSERIGEEKNISPNWVSNPDSPVLQPVV